MTRQVALGFFPAGELEKALTMWPGLLTGWGVVASHADYCREVDQHLRALDLPDGTEVLLAPIKVKHFVTWCDREALDPAAPDSRSMYATDVATRGRGRSWPPPRGKRCWCGRAEVYENCCGI